MRGCSTCTVVGPFDQLAGAGRSPGGGGARSASDHRLDTPRVVFERSRRSARDCADQG